MSTRRQKEVLKGRMRIAVQNVVKKQMGVSAPDCHTLLSFPCIYGPQRKELPHKAFVNSSDVLSTPPAASSVRDGLKVAEQGNVLALGPEQALYELNLLPVGLAGLPAV